MLRTSAAVAQPRRAVPTARRMFPRPRTEWASVLHRIGRPASTHMRTCSSRRSRRSGSPLTSKATRSSSATAITSSRSTALGGRRPIIRPVGWLSSAHRRVAQRGDRARRDLASSAPAGPRGCSPSPSRARPGHGRPGRASRRAGCRTRSRARTRNGASSVVGLGDLAPPGAARLASRGREPRRPPWCGRRSPGTRSLGLGRPWPSRARFAGRPTRSCGSGGRRARLRARRAAAARRGTVPRAAPAGTTGRRAPGRRLPRRARRGAARARSTYSREPVARTSSVPKRPGSASHHLDRHAFDRHAHRPPLLALEDRDDLPQRLEALEHVRRLLRRADDGEVLAQIAHSPRIAGRLAAERLREPGFERQSLPQRHPAPRRRLSALQRLEQLGRSSSGRSPALR